MSDKTNFKIMYHLLGEQTIPAYLASIQFAPDIKHYILTTESDKTKKAAQSLQNTFHARGYQSELYFIGKESSAVSSFMLQPEIEKIIEKTNPANEPACAEVTGGTKLMFYAMSVVALQHKMTLIYVDTPNRKLLYLNNGSVADLTTKMTLSDFVELSGNKFCKKEYKELSSQEQELADFFYKHYELIQMKQEEAASCLIRKGLSTKDRQETANEIIKQLKKMFKDTNGKFNELWNLYSKDKSWEAQMRFIGGEWFESYTYAKIKKLVPEITEIRRGTEVSYFDGEQAVQEFDVMYTDGYTLIILECKAGKVKQEHIQKLENLRNTFSGALGKCALVTLTASKTKSNRAQSFSSRIENSKSIAAFCGRGGLGLLPTQIFKFRTGKIYEG